MSTSVLFWENKSFILQIFAKKQKYQATNIGMKSEMVMFAASVYYLTSKVDTNQE